MGCRTDVEVMVMNLPQRFRCMWGMTSRAKVTTLKKFTSTALRQSSGVSERKFFAGGPPALATATSIPPKCSAAAATKRRSLSASVTSTASTITSVLWRLLISAWAASKVF